jgi:hypothetical protein
MYYNLNVMLNVIMLFVLILKVMAPNSSVGKKENYLAFLSFRLVVPNHSKLKISSTL